MLSPPSVLFNTDADLGLGVFGIATRMVQRGRKPADAPVPATVAATMVYRPATDAAAAAPVTDRAPVERVAVWLTVDGERHPVDKRVLVLGRGQECDVRLADPNVSRKHAELRQEETSYRIVDLGSTNGMEVNGRRLRQAKLEGGDRITLGSTDVVFERELP